MAVTAIVVAAGRGLRFKSKTPKPFVKVNSRPIITYCLKILDRHPSIRDIIVVVNPENYKDSAAKIKKYRIGKVSRIIAGGKRRQDSVRCGLDAVDKHTDLVLIHDGVRPFINSRIVSSVIKEAKRTGAAIAGVPVVATIKKVTKSQSHKGTRKLLVEKTIDRSRLWEVQTPQAFKKDLILEAYRRFGKTGVTDDAMLVEKLRKKVSIVPGAYDNIKITTPEDLVLAEAIARKIR